MPISETWKSRASFLHERTSPLSEDMFARLEAISRRSIGYDEKIDNYFERLAAGSEIDSAHDWLEVFHDLPHYPYDEVVHNGEIAFGEAFTPFSQWVAASIGKTGSAITQGAVDAFVSHAARMAQFCLYTEWSCLPGVEREPEKAYWTLVNSLLHSQWQNIADRYPVLLRLICEAARNTVAAAVELRFRLAADSVQIEGTFGVNVANLSKVEFGLSDFHSHGRTVARLTFETGYMLYYKPRCIGIERWFHDQLIPSLEDTPLLELRTLARPNYGWVEDAREKILDNLTSGQSDESMFGCTAALMCMLNATDLHVENVAFGKGWLIPVDLETLFSASPNAPDLSGPLWRSWTVLSTDLFDANFADISKTQSVSGFFATEPEPNLPVGFVERAKGKGVFLRVHDGSTVEAKQVTRQVNINELLDNMDEWFIRIKTERNRIAYLYTEVSETWTRSVLRPTALYERIWQRLTQPSNLANGSVFHLEALRLVEAGIVGDDRKAALLIGVDEVRQICNGDIPHFRKRANGRDLHDDEGQVVAENFFAESGISLAQQKLEEFNLTDRKEQRLLAAASLDISEGQRILAEEFEHECLFDVIGDIACGVTEGALEFDNEWPRWISYVGDASGSTLTANTNDRSLYAGSLGVVMFLAAYEKLAMGSGRDCTRISSLLDATAMVWCRSGPSLAPVQAHLPLGLQGVGGDLFAVAFLVNTHPRWSFLRDFSLSIAIDARSMTTSDRLLDVIGGSAGLLLGGTAAWHAMADGGCHTQSIVQLLADALNRIDETSIVENGRRSWKIPGEKAALLGYSHGGAGFIAAAAGAVTVFEEVGDTRRARLAYQIVEEACAYEDLYRLSEASWPDLRNRSKGRPMDASWCHGMAGILHAKLAAVAIGIDMETISLKNALMQSIEKESHLGTFCCGVAGGIDALISIGRREELKRLLSNTLSYRCPVVSCETTIGLATQRTLPSLYQGLTGVGYVGLRLLDPTLPSLSGAYGC